MWHWGLEYDAENSALVYITGILTVIFNHDDISQYYCFYCILDQINAALVSRKIVSIKSFWTKVCILYNEHFKCHDCVNIHKQIFECFLKCAINRTLMRSRTVEKSELSQSDEQEEHTEIKMLSEQQPCSAKAKVTLWKKK